MADSYVVTATVLYTRDKEGNQSRYFRGETVSGLSKDDVERFKAANAIASPGDAEAKDAKAHPAEADHAATSVGPRTEPERHEPDPSASEIMAARNSGISAVKRPPNTATDKVWREYAVESGQMTEEQAKKLSRDELRDELG
jgi:hypothetical protein